MSWTKWPGLSAALFLAIIITTAFRHALAVSLPKCEAFEKKYKDDISAARRGTREEMLEIADTFLTALPDSSNDPQFRKALLFHAIDFLMAAKQQETRIADIVHSALKRYPELDEEEVRSFVVDETERWLRGEKDWRTRFQRLHLAGIQCLELSRSLLLKGDTRGASRYRNKLKAMSKFDPMLASLMRRENDLAKIFSRKCLEAKGNPDQSEENQIAANLLLFDETTLDRYWFVGESCNYQLNSEAAFRFLLEHNIHPAMPFLKNAANDQYQGLAGFCELLTDQSLFPDPAPDAAPESGGSNSEILGMDDAGNETGGENATIDNENMEPQELYWEDRVVSNLSKLDVHDLAAFANIFNGIAAEAESSRARDLYSQASIYIQFLLFQKLRQQALPGMDRRELWNQILASRKAMNDPKPLRSWNHEWLGIDIAGIRSLAPSPATAGRPVLKGDLEIFLFLDFKVDVADNDLRRTIELGDVSVVFERPAPGRSPSVSVRQNGREVKKAEYSDYRKDHFTRFNIRILRGQISVSIDGRKIINNVRVFLKDPKVEHRDRWLPQYRVRLGENGVLFGSFYRTLNADSFMER